MSITAGAYAGLVLVFIFWGSLYVVSAIVLRYMPTFLVMGALGYAISERSESHLPQEQHASSQVCS